MQWTEVHGPLLTQAFAKVLGHPEAGAVAFARCLTPDVVARLAADPSFAPGGWQVWRVAGEDATRSITGDRAVELRERKGDAVLLLVDTSRAGAGMDGIYSAAREVEEAGLFAQAQRAALTAISRRHSTVIRRYAEEALKQAARGPGGREAVSPWTAFDFLCRVAAGGESPGTYVHSLGLWPIRYGDESDHDEALRTARRFVDTLLGPATAPLAPAARIDALRLDAESQRQKSNLERFVHRVDAMPLRAALDELARKHQSLWVGPLRIEGPAQAIRNIVLTPWRDPKTRRLHRWSGLTLNEDDTPELVLNSDDDGDGPTLEVRWKSDPKGLQRHAVDYRVIVQTSGLDEPLAETVVRHLDRKGGEKCRFSRDDFSLDDDARLSAEVVVSVLGDDTIESQRTDEFVIRFGQPSRPETGGVGLRVRTFSEGLTDLGARDAVAARAAAPPVSEGRDYVTLRIPFENGRHKSYRVLRPSLLAEVERDWGTREGSIGRWVQKVRGSGERVGSAEFLPVTGNGGAQWDRAETASRRMAARFAETLGGVAQVYDERSKTYDQVKYYLRAWLAVLENGAPELALANTVEVRSQSGSTIGLIVLPAHPLRMAWHAAYDNLVLHAVFEQHAKPGDIREGKELRSLDGAMFPSFLPNPRGGAFVFADTLGFHAVGMVPDRDPEPKAALAMLACALGGSGAADTAPTVGGQSAKVAGDEIVKYLECHDTARLLLVHALRAGDGMTVARALGAVHEHYRKEGDGADDEDQSPADDPVFALELYPSQQQRGVTGRFIADARERRRSGAGVLAEQDRWMLESVSLPGGVNQPRLRWARRESAEPETAAHVAVAFDTFDSRVCASSVDSWSPRPYQVFGLLTFYERQYQSYPEPRWTSVAWLAERGERHPSSRSHSQTLSRLQRALYQATTRHLGAAGLPALRTEIAADKEESLRNLHGLCDWVVTLDRNAGIEYFDSPHAHPAIYDAYVIDCVPERDDLGCLQMITSTANFDAFRTLLDYALDQMGLSRSRRNSEFLMEHLKALSGRLAIRLTGQRPATAELVALAVAHANCRAHTGSAADDCWVSLADGFIIPVDDVRDLLPPLEDTKDGADDGRRSRPDLIYVTTRPRRALAFRFIEVKYRRHLRAARAPDMLEDICRQTQGLHERWSEWYGRDRCAAFRAVRRAKLARVLRFYADKAWRHGLSQERHGELVAEIDRMVERGGEYEFAEDPAGDRGWVFCPEYAGDQPQRISVDHAAPTIFLFGAGRLPDSDFRAAAVSPQSTNEQTAPTESKPTVAAEADAATADMALGTDAFSARAHAARAASGGAPSTAGGTPPDAAPVTPSVCLGADARTNAEVRWPLAVQGNPHLLIAGLPGMGKTTCLINLCRQMVAEQVRPIIFSYHEDIDEKLAAAVANVRFIDFADGLGFHPLQVVDRSKRMVYLDVAAELRDIFAAIYPELGDLQGERLRSAVKDSFSEAGWGSDGLPTSAVEPEFVRFVEILRAEPRPDKGLRTLLARLAELEDYGFFNLGAARHSLWEHEQPTVVRIHTTQNENLQRAFAALVFYGLYKDMFRRGTQEHITHALIFDEAHRAARLRLIPTMAKECRKYGISLVLASQEARDFHSSVFSAIANYLVLRLTETDARFLVRNVASSQQERALIDRIKQMDRFKGLFFSEGNSRPHTVHLTS